MSRFGEYDGDGDDEFNGNGGYMWAKRAQLALEGKRGRKALTDLREALMALPEKRLISRALCTVGLEEKATAMPVEVPSWGSTTMRENYEREDLLRLAGEQGPGVCAIGAYVWFQKVKAGMDPTEAFASLPTLADIDEDGGAGEETARVGQSAGLTYTLAWELASRNDSDWGTLTPDARWPRFVEWIDKQLARPPLTRPARRPKRSRRATVAAAVVQSNIASGQLELGL